MSVVPASKMIVVTSMQALTAEVDQTSGSQVANRAQNQLALLVVADLTCTCFLWPAAATRLSIVYVVISLVLKTVYMALLDCVSALSRQRLLKVIKAIWLVHFKRVLIVETVF